MAILFPWQILPRFNFSSSSFTFPGHLQPEAGNVVLLTIREAFALNHLRNLIVFTPGTNNMK